MSTTIAIVVFPGEDEAKAAVKRMQTAEKDHLIEVEDAVLVTKDEQGKVHVKEYKDFTTRRGAIAVPPIWPTICSACCAERRFKYSMTSRHWR